METYFYFYFLKMNYSQVLIGIDLLNKIFNSEGARSEAGDNEV